MARPKTESPLTPAQKQRAYRERIDVQKTQDAHIAAAARILHGELLLSAQGPVEIPDAMRLKDTATFLRWYSAELEHERRKRARKVVKKRL